MNINKTLNPMGDSLQPMNPIGFFYCLKMSDVKRYEYDLIRGLTDWQLRTLYNESRSEMKFRNLIIYDAKSDSFVDNNNEDCIVEKGLISRPKSHGLIRLDKSKEPLKTVFAKNMLNPDCSILSYWLSEDWSFLFNKSQCDESKYYVYYHFDPTTKKQTYGNARDGYRMAIRFAGMPFYIGKGCGDRYLKMSGRNTAHLSRVAALEKIGYSMSNISVILCDGLTEIEALELESKLISFFGCMAEIPKDKRYFHGGHGGALINSDIGKRPQWVSELIHNAITRISRKKK